MEKAKELNAVTVEKTLSSPSAQIAECVYSFKIFIHENFGRAFIGWMLHPNYAIGEDDRVQLREGSTFIGNFPVKTIVGAVDTGHVWGSGLNASYWAWNYGSSPGWRRLCLTGNT
jgi:hypothetical protein